MLTDTPNESTSPNTVPRGRAIVCACDFIHHQSWCTPLHLLQIPKHVHKIISPTALEAYIYPFLALGCFSAQAYLTIRLESLFLPSRTICAVFSDLKWLTKDVTPSTIYQFPFPLIVANHTILTDTELFIVSTRRCSGCDSLFPSLMLLEHHKEEFEHWSDMEDENRRYPCCRRNRGDEYSDTETGTSDAESEDLERLL